MAYSPSDSLHDASPARPAIARSSSRRSVRASMRRRFKGALQGLVRAARRTVAPSASSNAHRRRMAWAGSNYTPHVNPLFLHKQQSIGRSAYKPAVLTAPEAPATATAAAAVEPYEVIECVERAVPTPTSVIFTIAMEQPFVTNFSQNHQTALQSALNNMMMTAAATVPGCGYIAGRVSGTSTTITISGTVTTSGGVNQTMLDTLAKNITLSRNNNLASVVVAAFARTSPAIPSTCAYTVTVGGIAIARFTQRR